MFLIGLENICVTVQFTVVDDASSKSLHINCGVPQGSVLGPLLFLLYINDIYRSTNISKIKLFADDSNVFVFASNLTDLFIKGNAALCEIFDWTVCNKISLNFEKSNYMLFKPPSNLDVVLENNVKLKLLVNNRNISRVSSVKYLGVWIDEHLTWKVHVDNLITKIGSLNGIVFRNKDLLPLSARKNLYFALAHSSLVYCIEIYGTANLSVLKPLMIKCNFLLRTLQNKPRLCHVRDLYISYNTLPINLLFKFYVLKLMHIITFNSNLLPSFFCELFCSNNEVHTYNTRFAHNLRIQIVTNSKSITSFGPSLFSNLPSPLRACTSLVAFSRLCKSFLSESF